MNFVAEDVSQHFPDLEGVVEFHVQHLYFTRYDGTCYSLTTRGTVVDNVALPVGVGHDDHITKLAPESFSVRERIVGKHKQAYGVHIEGNKQEASLGHGGQVFDEIRERFVIIRRGGCRAVCNRLDGGTYIRWIVYSSILCHGSVGGERGLIRDMLQLGNL